MGSRQRVSQRCLTSTETKGFIAGEGEGGRVGELSFTTLFTQLLNSDCRHRERILDFKEHPATQMTLCAGLKVRATDNRRQTGRKESVNPLYTKDR